MGLSFRNVLVRLVYPMTLVVTRALTYREDHRGMDSTTRSVLDESKKVSSFHQHNQQAMEDIEKRFHCSALFEEFKILDRLLYKYHNQQRRHVHYRRLRLVRRRLQRIQSLLHYTHWAVMMKNNTKEGSTIIGVLYDSLTRARQDCLNAYEALYAVLQDLLYVPFAMMCIGAIARIHSGVVRLSQIVNAFRLDLHASGTSVPGADTESVVPVKRERLETGWDNSTSAKKRKRFTKKVKMAKGDEIDQIFDD